MHVAHRKFRKFNPLLEKQTKEKDELPGPLVATEQLLQGCMCMVDRHVGAALTADAWNQLLDGEEDEEDAKLTVRYIQGKADPSTRKVIERLLRVNRSDRDKEIRVADPWRNWSSFRESLSSEDAQGELINSFNLNIPLPHCEHAFSFHYRT